MPIPKSQPRFNTGPAPERIVTLLPSATEIICGLGLGHKLVGITHECDYPEEIRHLPAVTRSAIGKNMSSRDIDDQVRNHLSDNAALYSLDMPLLESLAPDLIVTQALCDVCAVSMDEVSAACENLTSHPKLLNLEPMSLGDVFDTILAVGDATSERASALEYVAGLKAKVEGVRQRRLNQQHKPRVVFLEWIDPPFNAGHWTPELIEIAGGEDCLGSKHQPSRTIGYDEIARANPDVIVIAQCGFDIERSQADMEILKRYLPWQNLKAVRDNRVHVVDGNAYFSRSGPRLVDSLLLLEQLLWRQPDLYQLNIQS